MIFSMGRVSCFAFSVRYFLIISSSFSQNLERIINRGVNIPLFSFPSELMQEPDDIYDPVVNVASHGGYFNSLIRLLSYIIFDSFVSVK